MKETNVMSEDYVTAGLLKLLIYLWKKKDGEMPFNISEKAEYLCYIFWSLREKYFYIFDSI